MSSISQSSIRLLLIDDQPKVLSVWEKILTSQYNYQDITLAESAKKAIELLQQGHYEAIIADMRMEKDDSGFDILEFVTQQKINAVVIIVTANDSPKDCRRAFRTGAWDYISKNNNDIFNELNQSIKDAMTYLNEWGNIKDEKWVKDNWETLLTDYSNQYIAVLNHSVIAHADNPENLDNELKAKRLPLFLPYITCVQTTSPHHTPILELIQQQESCHLEFKKSYTITENTHQLSEPEFKQQQEKLKLEVMTTIAAFLNSGDGTLILGIEDEQHDIIGIDADLQQISKKKDQDGFQLHIIDIIKDRIGATFTELITFRWEIIEEKTIVAIDVKRAEKPVFFREKITKNKAENKIYIRSDGQTLPVTKPEEIYDFIWQRLYQAMGKPY
ncbi:MAG: response regulator [Thiotrichaceae bacterium]|nr:response regulator [Thiotrichaceae bacterium]